MVVLFGIAGTFIFYLSWPLLTGKAVVLATQPVDPFDIFRGQYLTINYEVGTVPVIDGVNVGETVYVVLKEDEEGIWRYERASLVKPGGTFIKGEVNSLSGENMRIEYGIEQYFFERNAKISTRGMTVEVKLSEGGNARISGLLMDGEPIEIEYGEIGLGS